MSPIETVPFNGATSLAIPVESNDGAGPSQTSIEESETSFDLSLEMEDSVSEELRDDDSHFVRLAQFNNNASINPGNLFSLQE